MGYFSYFQTCGVSAALMLASLAAAAPASSATLGGSWQGNGFITPSSGERTNVRCRVTYNQQSQKVFGVSATCASKENSLRQTGEVLMVRPGRFVGDFYSQQFDVGGRISVTIRGATQTVTFSGGGVTGRLTLRRR